MIEEVDEVLGLFCKEQPITPNNKRWVENVVREVSTLGDFQVPLRKDQLPVSSGGIIFTTESKTVFLTKTEVNTKNKIY